ncbi:MAG: hypothetical protein AABY64_00210 [Bdellovibrionota bacterium]
MSRFFGQIILSLFFITSLSLAQTKPLSDLTASDYPKLVKILGKESYQAETIYKLAKPVLLYVDKEWLTENGYETRTQSVGEFERKFLDVLGFAAPVAGESPLDFTKETKIFYSDYYGGDGIGNNRGSGRAAATGQLQIKGIGQTKMVHESEKTDKEHSSGTAGLYEGIIEVLASQIAHHELPFGANRVVALIATGTLTEFGEPRVLIVREDPLRPAHFIINDIPEELSREINRMRTVFTNIDKALPLPAGASPRSAEERIAMGVQEFIRRQSKLAAYSYANHFLHSAFSPSNVEISGAALDFGAFMALDGYTRAGRPEDNELNGDTNAVESVLREFLESLRERLPVALQKLVPTIPEAVQFFRNIYVADLQYEMALLTGAPEELVKNMRKSAQFRDFANTLIQIARDGNDEIFNAFDGDLKRTGTYNLEAILNKMSTELEAAQPLRSNKILAEWFNQVLTSEIPNITVRKKLIEGYVDFVSQMGEEALKQGIAIPNMKKYMALASRIRNRSTPALMRRYSPGPRAAWKDKFAAFKETMDPQPIRQALENTIRNNRRTFHDAKPFTLVLQEKNNGNYVERETYNLRTDKIEKTILEKKINLNKPRTVAPLCSHVFM